MSCYDCQLDCQCGMFSATEIIECQNRCVCDAGFENTPETCENRQRINNPWFGTQRRKNKLRSKANNRRRNKPGNIRRKNNPWFWNQQRNKRSIDDYANLDLDSFNDTNSNNTRPTYLFFKGKCHRHQLNHSSFINKLFLIDLDLEEDFEASSNLDEEDPSLKWWTYAQSWFGWFGEKFSRDGVSDFFNFLVSFSLKLIVHIIFKLIFYSLQEPLNLSDLFSKFRLPFPVS